MMQDVFLVGIGASPGIAIGSAYVVDRRRMSAVERAVEPGELDAEIRLFEKALQRSRQELEDVKNRVADPHIAEHLHIIDTHLMILKDPMLVDETIAVIRRNRINAEGALLRVLGKFRAVFDTIDDEYLRERRSDIDSVGERVLRNLVGVSQQSLADIERKSVIVAHDISPTDTMQMDKARIIGFVTDLGGRTSHTTILARSLGIPAVVGLENVTSRVREGMPVIIDGSTGTVVLNPSHDTFREYLEKKRFYEYQAEELTYFRGLEAVTLDGHRVVLRSNIEIAEEVPIALREGAQGVGLFRTEFLYMKRNHVPSEEEQLSAYRQIIESMAPHPVTIRTLDVGGDKLVSGIDLSDEANPAMGLRAIRFSLKEKNLFKVQLRAILRASAFGNARILFPMITGVAEIKSCKCLLQEIRQELVAEGHAFDPDIEIGIMIETPAAALVTELLAREVDFLSVGTNDLIQYCLAVDRGNEHVAYLFEPLHPAILRTLRMICDAAKQAGVMVGICGEMAGDPLYALVLLGLGFDEWSMNAPYISQVKRIIRQVHRPEAERLVEELFELGSAPEAARRLAGEMNKRFPSLFSHPTAVGGE
ncbi:MAG: phosphoenolpyruvate--protein phosphotransferase [Syntrophotalea acetylenica]|uniref:Phosphoenolpyruvate-protein phosphotransferase n=1 Tax=Syntrophotalea acetylenica TaxID=29542 RepID=A0A1L3GK63_SYNAC|nr:phosphoenolpyruvate--protein phosphotransferase [Syntrophotalea acetylenica]APG26058.1 phosphoenolpyruvate--protein phosphotransferase [Syntrophotalea acetylenica]APG44122.1 phosphoenolpyruvate--protein phosphotransferase [Syntrophotalea acetylenica]MDD4456274.1 phosphoenolpyruvate--protein phosphotransferase [Syntrophotalea acetylenica]